ncbi:ethanolamine utilization protein EutJ [Budvicia diplopodorum]|uniref:ethanolamine utilization protein EutJ n=1 Tax=Budvicia diplopodorum TaxID=1119056 RepID=UPI00135A85F9|nr:ethanolamine utilization protein EutJ [Budvicia diplopodorum]
MANAESETLLLEFARLVREAACNPYCGDLKVGVDLGTANIVLAVVDSKNNPIAGVTYPSTVVRDGIVVDYPTATRVVKQLKQQLEQRLGCTLTYAATAIPPGISAGNTKIIANVVESAGFEVTNIVDEPVAAASVLKIRHGAVVDVGGGTTGMSILRNGKVIFSDDEPTGGTHMTLVLAGALGISFAQADEIKKDPAREQEVFAMIKPVVEKMASIVDGWLRYYATKNIYVVGGASHFEQFTSVFANQTGRQVIRSIEPLFVTPLGIALSVRR